MTPPWRIYIAFTPAGTIRKWQTAPFEIDGQPATAYADMKVDGIHTCHDACERPLCAMRRENDRLKLRVAELGG